MPRDADFSEKTKTTLAKKVGYRCSNPFCRICTIGANADGSDTISIGEAAHITAAEPGGPRYDPNLTMDERKAESNGIWLCRNHAAMIDRDENFFTVDLIRRWKADAEKEANDRIQGIVPSENLQFNLRVLFDDLAACCETIDRIISFERTVVVPPTDFPVTSDYEKKIECVVDSIGMNYASRMRRCFMRIADFKNVLEEESPRMKHRVGVIADIRAVTYSHKLKAFLARMEEYDIHELVKTIGKLFEDGCPQP